MTQKLSSNETEAANRAEATALLIRAGFRVYRPEADVLGEDLALRTPSGELRMVQLKSRASVDLKRYGNRGIWLLFPEPGYKLGRPWYLIPHDVLFAWVQERHGNAPAWAHHWTYPSLSLELQAFLSGYRHDKWSVAGLADDAPVAHED